MPTCRPAHIICCGWLILLCAHADMPIYSKIWSGSEICEGEHSKMSKVARKLLGHVTMWCVAGHISHEVYDLLVIAAVLMDFHMGYSYWILIWKTSINLCTMRGQLLLAILILNSLFEYFYGIHANSFMGVCQGLYHILYTHMRYSIMEVIFLIFIYI